jgi:predicted phage terminase large subunit-like protein
MSQTLSDLMRLAASAGLDTWQPEHQAELRQLLPDFRRLLVRESLVEWSRLCGFEPAAHHRLIIRELEAIGGGRNDRLILSLPPGAAKSTFASVLFPPWYLANHPKNLIIAASHTVELAERWGRRVRNLIEEHSETLDFGIRLDNAAAGRWETSTHGEYFATGVGGALSGRRADCLIVDDYLRSAEDADSKLIRDKHWDWWVSDAVPRLKPHASCVIINTRWHEDDLVGRLLREEPGRWKVLNIPMESESLDDPLHRPIGARLWPEWFTQEMVEVAKRNARIWSALYQGRPAPDDGSYFKREWLIDTDVLPDRSTLRVYGGSDYAVTSNGGDYTVHCVVGVDNEHNLYLLDLWRKQASSDEWVEAYCDLVKKHKPMGWAEESGQIKSGVGPFLLKRMRERQAYTVREQFPTRHDKAVRAQSIRGRMAMQGLRVLRQASYRNDLIDELLRFPVGVHDDQCVVDGTQITMADGSRKAIECVRVGEMVATPVGPCRVDASEITDEAAEVCRVVFSDGSSLTGTLNHRIFVHGKGLVRLDALSIMDQCVGEAQGLKLSNIAGTGTADIPTAIARHIGAISLQRRPGLAIFTGMFGKTRTVQSRLGATFTTLMAIGATTLSKISSSSPPANTGSFTRWWGSDWKGSVSIWHQFVRRLLSGTPVMAVASGTVDMANAVGKAASASHLPSAARHVGLSFERRLSGLAIAAAGANSADLVVGRHDAGAMLQMAKRWCASVATGLSLRSGLTSRATARRRAACVIAKEVRLEPMRVRNLTVSGAHVYYANGILSRNCDALGLVGQLLDKMLAPVRDNVVPFKRRDAWDDDGPSAVSWKTV